MWFGGGGKGGFWEKKRKIETLGRICYFFSSSALEALHLFPLTRKDFSFMKATGSAHESAP